MPVSWIAADILAATATVLLINVIGQVIIVTSCAPFALCNDGCLSGATILFLFT